jgi:hypothetical protein
MSTWQEFYNQIRDCTWPDCATEAEFSLLPEHIQQECQTVHGYVPGAFRKISKLPNQIFPIKTATACQLKWNWSTIFLTSETTASCHRTDHHKFDTDTFDFHNTPSKLNDRRRMLRDEWPTSGCDYCRNIESAGGSSDRITNLDFPGIHAPPELDNNPTAVHVTPRILEVYFDNTCNLKCLYCGPHFSSLWDAENIRFGESAFNKSTNISANKKRIFAWLREHGHNLTNFNILGGEPLYQSEFEECLDLFEQYPAPELKLQIFTNLNAKLPRLQAIVERIRTMVERDQIREFEITASLDCWGPAQEYVRYPLDLATWQANFEYLVSQPWINLIIGSTVTPLTIKTLPDLLERINEWNQIRPIHHYQNSVNSPSYLFIDIFGDIFREDFDRAIALKTDSSARNYLAGIAQQSVAPGPNVPEIINLYNFLIKMDQRRSTNWRKIFPWLINEFAKYGLID